MATCWKNVGKNHEGNIGHGINGHIGIFDHGKMARKKWSHTNIGKVNSRKLRYAYTKRQVENVEIVVCMESVESVESLFHMFHTLHTFHKFHIFDFLFLIYSPGCTLNINSVSSPAKKHEGILL